MLLEGPRPAKKNLKAPKSRQMISNLQRMFHLFPKKHRTISQHQMDPLLIPSLLEVHLELLR